MKNLFGKIKSLLSRILGKNKGEDRPAEGGLSQAKNIQIDDRKALKKGKYGFEGQLINDIAGYIAKCKDHDGPLHAKAFRALYVFKRAAEKNIEECNKSESREECRLKDIISIDCIDSGLIVGFNRDLNEELKAKLGAALDILKDKLASVSNTLEQKRLYDLDSGVRNSWDFISALEKDGGDKLYLYHFKTLFALTEADGDISLSELLHIKEMMKAYISDRKNTNLDLYGCIEKATGTIKNFEKDNDVEKFFKENKENKGEKYIIVRHFLSDLIHLAYADGECDKEEYKKLKKFREKYNVVSKEDFVKILMNEDRITYTPIERLKKDYWKKELSPNWWNKILDIWFLPFRGIGKIIRACVTKNSSGRIVAAIIIVIIGIAVYMYSLNDNLWEAIIESTSSFFRSYGGFRGEKGEIAVTQKYIYYLFQMLTMSFVIGLTFFHFGKEVGNEINRKKAIFNITKCNLIGPFGIFKRWFKKCWLRCCIISVTLVALTAGFWLSCSRIAKPIKVGEVSIVKDRANIVMDVGISIEGSGVFTNRLGHSEIVLECNTNRFIASIINTEKVENKEIIFPNEPWDLLNGIYCGIKLCYAKLRFFVVNILFDACTYIDLWNNACNFGDDVWNLCYEFMVRPYYLPILKGCHSYSFFISLLLCYLALSSIYVLVRMVVYVINFVGFLFKLNFCNRHKLYVIWGGVSNGELRDEAIALMADIRRSKEGNVLIMLDKDSIEKERYDGITDYLREFDVCWKYVSYGRLNKYDAYGDCHFFIDKEGRKNRVTAQSVIDRLKKDNEDKFLVMRTRKPQLHVLVKHSTEFDLSNWLNDLVVKEIVDLRVFNLAQLVSDDLFTCIDPHNIGVLCKRAEKILFLGIGRNARNILTEMFFTPIFAREENIKITICDSSSENCWRALLYLLDFLSSFDKRPGIEIVVEEFAMNGHLNTCLDWGKEMTPTCLRDKFKVPDDFYKDKDKRAKYSPRTLGIKIGEQRWSFTFENIEVLSSKFKKWAIDNMLPKDFNSGMKYDYIFSCLGDSHDSLTTMRRIERLCGKKRRKLLAGTYFMQLKDSRYASMYEAKIGKNISIFGDLRRVYSVGKMIGGYRSEESKKRLEKMDQLSAALPRALGCGKISERGAKEFVAIFLQLSHFKILKDEYKIRLLIRRLLYAFHKSDEQNEE